MTTVEINGKNYPFHFGIKTNTALIDRGVDIEKKGTYTFLLFMECINTGLKRSGSEEQLTEDTFEEIVDEDFATNWAKLDDALKREQEKKTS